MKSANPTSPKRKASYTRYNRTQKARECWARYAATPAAKILRSMWWAKRRLWNQLRMQERRCASR